MLKVKIRELTHSWTALEQLGHQIKKIVISKLISAQQCAFPQILDYVLTCNILLV